MHLINQDIQASELRVDERSLAQFGPLKKSRQRLVQGFGHLPYSPVIVTIATRVFASRQAWRGDKRITS